MRITAACPETLRDDANHFAMTMAFGPADALTYDALIWQDAEGNLYAAASFEARPEWVLAAQSALSRPAWDTDQIIDMTAAARAQAALVFWTADSETPPPQASTTTLTAIGGMDGVEALAAMGLTMIEVEE